jgi:hypothetical protein
MIYIDDRNIDVYRHMFLKSLILELTTRQASSFGKWEVRVLLLGYKIWDDQDHSGMKLEYQPYPAPLHHSTS